MKRPAAHSPVYFVANVARLPQKGLPVVVEADAEQRAALAGEHAVRGPQSSAPRYARSSSSGSS